MSLLSKAEAMTMTNSDSPRVGRRERNMAEKRERIVQVAARLFAERSFDEVTTQLVSDLSLIHI